MSAIAQLAALQRERHQQATPKTLEHVIYEMIRPMLHGWLDDTLPEIIESLVRAELTRMLADGQSLELSVLPGPRRRSSGLRFSWINSNTCFPRRTLSMMVSGSAVQVKGLGLLLVSARKRLMAAWRSTMPLKISTA